MTSKALVVGSGAIGLRTALELLRNNVKVVLRSAHHPLHPYTCSQGAGGLWMPYKCSDTRVDRWAKITLGELLEFTKPEDISSHGNVVEIVPTLYLTGEHSGPKVDDFVKENDSTTAKTKSPSLPEWTNDPRVSFQHLSVEMLHFQNHLYKLRIPSLNSLIEAGFSHGWFFRPPVVDPPRMLMSMLDEIKAHPLTEDINVDMEDGGFVSMEDMLKHAHELQCDTLINCTGLGSKKLCNDDAMIGGRGILLHYDRNCQRKNFDGSNGEFTNDVAITMESGRWGTSVTPENPAYIIPRGDVLVVGGAYHEGCTKKTLSDLERKRLKDNAELFGIDTEKADPLHEWAGFRPCRRPDVRLEIDKSLSSASGLQVVHSYGHGGSGWTTYVGIAKDTMNLLRK